jgi:DNA-binding transcriptional LysR family regulator
MSPPWRGLSDPSNEFHAANRCVECMDMTLDELASFVCIASGAGFTQASRRLNRSQPAISRRIHQLERNLDSPLFERVGRRVKLTDAGRALLPHAEAALAAVRDGEQAVRATTGKRTASLALKLAVGGTLADLHIVAALRSFRARHVGASIELRTANSRDASDLVRRGEADLGLRYQADSDPKLESIPLGGEREFVVVPVDHRIRAKRVRDLRVFESDALLGFPAEPRHPEASLERRLVAAGIASPRVMAVDSLTAQKRLVEAGLGIALLPRSSFSEELRGGRLRIVEVTNLKAETPVALVRRRGGYRSPLADAFLAHLERGARRSLAGRPHARPRAAVRKPSRKSARGTSREPPARETRRSTRSSSRGAGRCLPTWRDRKKSRAPSATPMSRSKTQSPRTRSSAAIAAPRSRSRRSPTTTKSRSTNIRAVRPRDQALGSLSRRSESLGAAASRFESVGTSTGHGIASSGSFHAIASSLCGR